MTRFMGSSRRSTKAGVEDRAEPAVARLCRATPGFLWRWRALGASEWTRTIAKVESDERHDDVEFEIAMRHLCRHVNTAWNGHGAPKDQARRCSEENFYAWRQFSTDLSLD
jgi:hypothetical protein